MEDSNDFRNRAERASFCVDPSFSFFDHDADCMEGAHASCDDFWVRINFVAWVGIEDLGELGHDGVEGEHGLGDEVVY